MRTFLLAFLIIITIPTFSQRSAEALEKNETTLQERFGIMKEGSETYSDYKVVKGYVLDGMWKITMDSLKVQKTLLREANLSIVQLQGQLDSAKNVIEKKDSSMEDMVHASTHINVLGIDWPKVGFISTVGIIFLALLALAGIMFARVRWTHHAMREKTDMVDSLSNEFEEYKRKALDKQMKLSRELQNERNKLSEQRS